MKAEVSRIDLSDEMLGFLKNFRSTWRKQSNKINQQEDMLKEIMKRHESLASHFTDERSATHSTEKSPHDYA